MEKKTNYYISPKQRYLKEKVETFVVRVPKGQKQIIKNKADELGLSFNSYILSLISKDIPAFVKDTQKTM